MFKQVHFDDFNPLEFSW